VAEGKIRRWGVSNLDTDDMQALWRTAGGERCATNQVLYHLASRGIEYDLLPWCQQHTLPVMAYCPLAQAGRLRDGLFQHTDIINMANARGVTAAQLLLAWVIRHPGVLAIPKAASIEHVVQNAAALDIVLSEELAQLDRLYPPPQRKTRWIWFNQHLSQRRKSPVGNGAFALAFFTLMVCARRDGVSSLAFCGWVTQQVSTQTKVL
jgi:diketogulonate reductase-like aldo/keto reductase